MNKFTLIQILTILYYVGYLLGMDESKRRGRSTRKALNDFTLIPSICSTASRDENKLRCHK